MIYIGVAHYDAFGAIIYRAIDRPKAERVVCSVDLYKFN
jgi:hypothetical protein